MYTTNNTINELLADKLVQKDFEYMMPMFFLTLVPEDMRDLPIIELREKVTMPWGTPYFANEIVAVANQLYELRNQEEYQFIQLWEEVTPDGYVPRINGTKEGVGLLLFKKSFQANRPVALVLPGGAYETVSVSHEGFLTAKALEKAGYAVAVLNYRCNPNRYPNPQKDLALAIKRMRYIMKETGVAEDLLVMGFSAGGHLVASETCYANEIDELLMQELQESSSALYQKLDGISAKADKVCLSYPVISMKAETHEQSMMNLTEGDTALCDKLSIDEHVDADYPKTFLWVCEDDATVPFSNTVRMSEALKKAGVDSKCIIYPTGDHGIATAVGTSAEGWVDELVDFMKN